MDVREKLVALLGVITCPNTICNFCEHFQNKSACERHKKDVIADHLITNGVTVQALDGCEYCKEYEDLPEHFVSGKPVGRVFDTCIQTDEKGRWHIEVPSGADVGIKFCPMCGRKLPQPPKGE